MHTEVDVKRCLQLKEVGHNITQISRMTGINRRTITDWVQGKIPNFELHTPGACNKQCGLNYAGPVKEYVYLLGLYLGDGCISKAPRAFKLRITCCTAYPDLMDRCEAAIRAVMPRNAVGRLTRIGCTEIYGNSKHWPCLFPQFGAGPKHKRLIQLEPWQQQLVDTDPRPLVEGLIHSDGCRVLNKVNGTAYPRYHFSNRSMDIQLIFKNSLDQLGIEWRNNNEWNVSVAQRKSVEKMDSFISPKT